MRKRRIHRVVVTYAFDAAISDEEALYQAQQNLHSNYYTSSPKGNLTPAQEAKYPQRMLRMRVSKWKS